MIVPNDADVGRKVLYRAGPEDEPQQGTIQQIVRATKPSDSKVVIDLAGGRVTASISQIGWADGKRVSDDVGLQGPLAELGSVLLLIAAAIIAMGAIVGLAHVALPRLGLVPGLGVLIVGACLASAVIGGVLNATLGRTD